MGFTNFGKLFKSSFSSFLIVSPESDIFWKEDCRFIDPWEVQQKINPAAQENCVETPQAPLLGAVNSFFPPSPLTLGLNFFCSAEQAAVVLVQRGKQMVQNGRTTVPQACPSSRCVNSKSI